MNKNINALLNSMNDIHKIRKADKKIEDEKNLKATKSDNTMSVSALYKPKYRYFPTSKKRTSRNNSRKNFGRWLSM